MLGHAIYERNHFPLPRRVVVRTVSAFGQKVQLLKGSVLSALPPTAPQFSTLVRFRKVLQNIRGRYAHPHHGGTKSRQRR
jgi:hypothetical protein